MAASTTTTCSVCVEPFNNSRKVIVCMHCDLECCTECATKYLETSVLTPQCMQCHQLWSHQYIRERFGSPFVKKMADARKRVLFSEQQALFPHTQEYINLESRFEQIKNEEFALVHEMGVSKDERARRSIKLYNEKCNNRARINDIVNPLRVLYDYRNTHVSDVPTKMYTKPCGRGDCKGYVNAEDHTCELCRTEYCSECMEEKGGVHQCKPEDVSTAEMLRNDTKGCPKCAVPIHRISGCPDMFCVHCKTAFDWNSLRINERGNSNPHYYQWVRDNASATPTNMGCGVNNTPLSNLYGSDNFKRLDNVQKDDISLVISTLHHYQHHYNITKFYKEYSKTRQYQHDFHTITLKSRADYMQNKLTKEKFTQYLLKTNKAMEYNTNIDEIVRTIGLFRQQLIQHVVYSTEFDCESFMTESRNFVTYINKCVSHLEAVYYTKKKKTFIKLGI